MKLINSRKEIDDFMNERPRTPFFDEEEEHHGPCWEVKIDREDKKAMIFLIDGEEKLSYPLSKVDNSLLTIEKISGLIKLLRNGDFSGIKKVLKGR